MVYYANHTIRCYLAGWFQIEGTEELSVKRCVFPSFKYKPGRSDSIAGATINHRNTGTFHSLLMCKGTVFLCHSSRLRVPLLQTNNHFIPVYCFSVQPILRWYGVEISTVAWENHSVVVWERDVEDEAVLLRSPN